VVAGEGWPCRGWAKAKRKEESSKVTCSMEIEVCSAKGEMGGYVAKVGSGEAELRAWPGCVADGWGHYRGVRRLLGL